MTRLLVALLALASGCSGAEDPADRPCPPSGTTLTYEGFGRDFFEQRCVSCHGGPNGYSSRAFVTVESIRVQRDRIFRNAAGKNAAMPPGPDDIPQEDRQKLAEWLSCGAPLVDRMAV